MNSFVSWLTLALVAAVLTACETRSVVDLGMPAPQGQVVTVALMPCTDRTGTAGRDLAAEATRAFKQDLAGDAAFRLQPDGRYRLSCEVTRYEPGSAFVRWLAPGAGTTVGQVAAMLLDSQTGGIALIARGDAQVRTGGLYTIGAESYIVPTAVREVVDKLGAWARGLPAAGSMLRNPAASSQGAQT